MFSNFVFYLFSTILIASAVMVVSARNPIYSVLFLILCFFNAAALFLLLQAEFLAMILVIVYVGAVAVLFLFVVMMLDIDSASLRSGFLYYLPTGGLIALVLLAELLLVFGHWAFVPDVEMQIQAAIPLPGVTGITGTEALGNLLYTRYAYLFEAAGLLLLIAMVGSILLTLRHQKNSLHQVVSEQLKRSGDRSIEMVKVRSGEGVK